MFYYVEELVYRCGFTVQNQSFSRESILLNCCEKQYRHQTIQNIFIFGIKMYSYSILSGAYCIYNDVFFSFIHHIWGNKNAPIFAISVFNDRKLILVGTFER